MRNQTSSSNLWTVVSDAGSREYKGVIIATPFHASSIELPPALTSRIPPQPYVRIHVTLLTTAAHSPNREYFGLPTHVETPQAILTSSNARKGGKQPEFHSLIYRGLLEREGKEPERVVKIFSKERITDELLGNLFPGPLGWVHRQEVGLSIVWAQLEAQILMLMNFLVGRVSRVATHQHVPARSVGPWTVLRERLRAVRPCDIRVLDITPTSQNILFQVYLMHGNRNNRLAQRRRPAAQRRVRVWDLRKPNRRDRVDDAERGEGFCTWVGLLNVTDEMRQCAVR
jgi:hypothetical protein